MVFFSTNKQKNGQQVCATYTWKTSVLEMGGFALDLTRSRPPIWWWSCHLRVQTQREIFWVWKSDLHPCPDTRPFLLQDVWRRHCKAQEGEPFAAGGEHTHSTNSTDPRAGSHTVTPWHRLTLCPLCSCLLAGDHTQAGFPWKNCRFQSYVLPSTPLPVFLPMHSVWRMGRWWQCLVGKMLWTLWQEFLRNCYFVAAAIIQQNKVFSRDFQLRAVWKGSTKDRNIFLCFAGELLAVECIVSKRSVSYMWLCGREEIIRHIFTTWGRILNVTELHLSHYTVFRGLNGLGYHDSRKKFRRHLDKQLCP